MLVLLAPLLESCKNQGTSNLFFLEPKMNKTCFDLGMYHLKCPTLRMRTVTKGCQEKGIFGGLSWVPQQPNTTSQSE